MSEALLIFQKFHDPVLANEVANRLSLYNIPYLLEDNRHQFNPNFAHNHFDADINLKLHPKDFTRAQTALEEYYKQQLEDVDPSYYLFNFTDKELIEIITRPDEWGQFDYQLAQKLLTERGLEIKPELAQVLKSQRIDELNKPEAAPRYLIFLGYFLSVFGVLLGVFIGWTLAYLKRTLPDGRRVYVYSEEDRNHSTRMQLTALLCIIIVVLLKAIDLL